MSGTQEHDVDEAFVRHQGLLVPHGVVDGQAAQAEVLRRELVEARELAVAQQAEHRAAVATLIERSAAWQAEPAGDVEPVEPVEADAARLRRERAAARDLIAVESEDVWARQTHQAEHRIAMADLAERAAAAERARRDRAQDAVESDALVALYRRATRSGARAQIRTQIQGSAEMRALRIAAVRRVALLAGLPVLTAFAAWSTTGVQAGVVRLLGLPDVSAAWWASWAVEPALITIVALLIIGRAVLRSSGGDTDWRATLAEWTALGLSLALNVVGGWSDSGGGFWAGLGTALPHAIGPFGCAGTAFLIGLFDSYVAAARPWDGAPRLADLDLAPQTPPAPPVHATATAVPLRPVADPTTGTGTRPAAVRGTGTGPVAVPGRHSGTGPGRTRPVTGTTGRRAISGTAHAPDGATGTTGGTPGSAKAAARAFWETEVTAGRVPTGGDLARAAGRAGDETGMFRRYARDWAAELPAGGTADVAS